MVITRGMLAHLLSMDLELEYSSAIQYINHASVITQMPIYRNVSKEIVLDAMEEIQHAVILSKHIVRLENTISEVPHTYASKNYQIMLLKDADEEADAVRRYQMRIGQAEQLKEYDLAQQLRHILEMEKEHLQDFRHHRLVHPRERQQMILEITDHDCFSEKWADRAMYVPVRTKKCQ